MRNRRPSKQRVWLGAGRHPCCGGRRYTNPNAHCYSDSDRYSNGQRDCHADGDRYGNGQPHGNSIDNSHAATDANPQSDAISKAAPNAFAQALALPSRQNFL